MKYLIATCGITHSGKTTFGKEIKSNIRSVPLLDSDEIYSLLNGIIPEIKETEKTRTIVNIDKPRLRHILFEEIIKFFLENHKSVICTNGNTKIDGRRKLRSIAEKHNAKFILIYFDFEKEVILDRIKNSSRGNDFLTNSNDYYEVFEKQSTNFEIPRPDEGDLFLRIRDQTEYKLVQSEIQTLLEWSIE